MRLQHFIVKTAPECAPIEAREMEFALSTIRPDTEIWCGPASGTYDGLRHTIADLTQERDALRRENEMLREKIEGMKPVCGWRLVGALERTMRKESEPKAAMAGKEDEK